ncbi:hypothetical protein GMDG_08577 [Pseudogymnoascus destructans 20631-21]|uniref:CFEM domain-containing protein n=1 Tax=Pseudogymnoascus destructans (strain ATCC MYA-4855 / 20631-21) TaxID=658429 RepID=L8G4C1_PSED2|nr:hypothetical protein GMDG_08577 [Pseudogymnoascus destructans 20631-21]
MKLSVLSVPLLPVLIHAQAIPDCATACLSSAIVAASCTPGDNACACTSAKQIEIGIAGTSCLLSSCSPEELPAVIAAGSAACSSYFATLSGSAKATTGSTATHSKSSESSGAPTITSERSTSTGTTSAPGTSGDPSDTMVPSDVSTTAGPASMTTGGAKAPSSSTGGAAAMATAFGGVAMALLGVAVAL